MRLALELTTATAAQRRNIRDLLLAAPQVHINATAPSQPVDSPIILWFDTDNSALKIWASGAWQQAAATVSHAHTISDVTGLSDALGGKASTSHTHSISAVTGLSDALSGKASTSHTHSISDVTGLSDALSGKASTSHTHSISAVTGLSDALSDKAAASHTHAVSAVTGLQEALDSKASMTVDSLEPEAAAGALWFDTVSSTLRLGASDEWLNAAVTPMWAQRQLMVYVPTLAANVVLSLMAPGFEAITPAVNLPSWSGKHGASTVTLYPAESVSDGTVEKKNKWCLVDSEVPDSVFIADAYDCRYGGPWLSATLETTIEGGSWATAVIPATVEVIDGSVYVGAPVNYEEEITGGTPGWIGRVAVDPVTRKAFFCTKNDLSATNDGWVSFIMSSIL